jgi:hypothetical protein
MLKSKKTEKKVKLSRLNLALAEIVRTRIEELQNETGAQTMTEVVSKSLAVYDFLWSRKKEGAKVLIEDSKGIRRELVLL